MCRYAMSGPYKSHFACFSCRKAFKQPSIVDYLDSRGLGYVFKQLELHWANKKMLKMREKEMGHRLDDLQEEYRKASHKCPECKNEMIDMGLDFKAPRQSNAKAWKTLLGMFHVGHAFHTCGCDGPGWIPKSTGEYRNYLASTRKHYQQQLEKVQKSGALSLEEKQANTTYWAIRIKAIDQEQNGVK